MRARAAHSQRLARISFFSFFLSFTGQTEFHSHVVPLCGSGPVKEKKDRKRLVTGRKSLRGHSRGLEHSYSYIVIYYSHFVIGCASTMKLCPRRGLAHPSKVFHEVFLFLFSVAQVMKTLGGSPRKRKKEVTSWPSFFFFYFFERPLLFLSLLPVVASHKEIKKKKERGIHCVGKREASSLLDWPTQWITKTTSFFSFYSWPHIKRKR